MVMEDGQVIRLTGSAARVVAIGSLAAALTACAQLKQVGQSLANLSAVRFKLESVGNFSLAGIPLTGKTGLSLTDAPKAVAAFANGSLPASFTLNVAALNPNDGHADTPATAATLVGLPWTLILDNTITVSGNLADAVTLPAGGERTLIPLAVRLDLVPFFKDKGYEHLVNLALALGGANGSPTRITLRARPEVRTPYGPIRYPGEIDIVDREYRAR